MSTLNRLETALQPVLRAGDAVARTASRTGLASLAAASVLVVGLSGAIASAPWWAWGLLGIAAVGFAAPGLVLIVFGQSLRQLMALPSSIAARARAESPTLPARGGPLARLWRVAVSLFRARDVYVETGSQIAQSALLLRLANPVTAVVVLGSLLVSGLLVPVAVVVLLALIL